MSLRADQMSEGSLNRWKARFGMTETEVFEARVLSKKLEIHMHEACRIVVRSADRKAAFDEIVGRQVARRAQQRPSDQGPAQ